VPDPQLDTLSHESSDYGGRGEKGIGENPDPVEKPGVDVEDSSESKSLAVRHRKFASFTSGYLRSRATNG